MASYRDVKPIDLEETPVKKTANTTDTTTKTPADVYNFVITPKAYLPPSIEQLINRMDKLQLQTPAPKKSSKEASEFFQRRLLSNNINFVRGTSSHLLDDDTVMIALQREHNRRKLFVESFKSNASNDQSIFNNSFDVLDKTSSGFGSMSSERIDSFLSETSMTDVEHDDKIPDEQMGLTNRLEVVSDVLLFLAHDNSIGKKPQVDNIDLLEMNISDMKDLDEEEENIISNKKINNPLNEEKNIVKMTVDEKPDLGEEILKNAVHEQLENIVTDKQMKIIEESFIQQLYSEFESSETDTTYWWDALSSIATPNCQRKIDTDYQDDLTPNKLSMNESANVDFDSTFLVDDDDNSIILIDEISNEKNDKSLVLVDESPVSVDKSDRSDTPSPIKIRYLVKPKPLKKDDYPRAPGCYLINIYNFEY